MITKGFKRCMALLVPFVLFVFVLSQTGYYFGGNDDRYITSILSGVITGSPDAHVIYVNYLLSFPLMLLYQITTNVPWYGGMLILFQGLVYAAVLDSIYSRCKKWIPLVSATVLICSFFLSYYYLAGNIQYTATAALLAAGGYACLLIHDSRKKGFAFFFVLEFLGFLLRSQAMLMVQPLGLAAVLVAISGEKIEWKAVIKKLLPVAAGLVLILGLGTAGNIIGYHGEEWKKYQDFNDMRTELLDYYPYVNGKLLAYEEIKDILEEYGISEKKYKAFYQWSIMDWKADTECYKQIKNYAAEKDQRPIQLGKRLEEIYHYTFFELPWGLQYITVMAWLFFFAWALLRKNWKMFAMGTVLLGGARTAVWAYLFWKGRIIARVIIPLLACEVLLLIMLVMMDCQKTEEKPYFQRAALIGAAIFCAAGIFLAREQLSYVQSVNKQQDFLMAELREMQEHCGENPQNHYVLEAASMSVYFGSALETSAYHPINAVVSGGWFSTAPAAQQRLEDYLGNADGFYLVMCADADRVLEETPIFLYLLEEMDGRCKPFELWTTSIGRPYAVYYFEGAFPFQSSQ